MSVSILVVDDEPDVADLFRQRFRLESRQETYVMHFAASGEQALDMLAGDIRPELIVILSDINMPGMDGLELLGEIKQRHPDLPVMMVTAYGDDERRRRATELGAIEFITKPVDFDRLKEQLRQLPAAANRLTPITFGAAREVIGNDIYVTDLAYTCSGSRWTTTMDHDASPAANRRPDRNSSRSSGLR